MLEIRTDLLEESFFNYLVQLEILRAIRYQNYVTLLLMEPDQDVHDAAKLKEVGNVLKQELRTTDIIGRLNSIQFGAILVHADVKSACIASERLKNRIQEYFYRQDHGLTISVGGACCPDDSTDSMSLCTIAQRMLIAAKANGGNSIIFYLKGGGNEEPDAIS